MSRPSSDGIALFGATVREATEMAEKLLAMAREIRSGKGSVKAPAAIIAGREREGEEGDG